MKKEQSGYGNGSMVEFKNFRERLVFIAVWKALFALRFSNYDAHKAAGWAIVLWRALRYKGSDNELQSDKFLGQIGMAYDTERLD